MKKYLSILLALAMLVSLAACGSKTPAAPQAPEAPAAPQAPQSPGPEQKTDAPAAPTAPGKPELLSLSRISQYDYVTEELNGYWVNLANYQCDLLALNDDLSEKYPELNDYLQSYNAYISDTSYEQMNRYADTAREAIRDGQDPEGFYAFPFENKLHVTRADSNIVSFAADFYSYMGGAHPDTWLECYNVDSKTGREFELTDFVKDMDGLKSLLVEKLLEKYPEIFEDEESLRESVEYSFTPTPDYDYSGNELATESMGVRWTAGYQGLTFYFNTYQLSFYAAGMQQVTVLIGEVPGLLFDEKLLPPEEYVTPFVGWYPEYDLNNDGVLDEITVYADGEYDSDLEENFYNSLTIITPFGSCEDPDFYANDYEAFIVHLKDETEILAVTGGDWWGGEFYIYDITVVPASCGSISGWVDGEILTDPAKVLMSTNNQICGTFFGTKNYMFGEYGAFYSEDPVWILDTELEMTTTEALELPMVADFKVTQKTIKLPAGSILNPVASDGASFIDLEDTKTGRTVRLEVTFGEYMSQQYLPDGRSIDDVFEMIYWAG